VTERAGFLDGLRVLELGDGVAGSAAASLLWALGAEVTAAVDPASPHRHGRPRAGDGTSLLARSLDRGKNIRTPSTLVEVEALVAQADVVVVDRVHGARGPLVALSAVVDHVAFVDAHRDPAWVTISAFGLTGPRAGDVATELTVAAASGMLSAVRDERTGQPLKLGGQQSLLNTGQAAALAACHAVDLRADGGPVHLDLSAVEATLAMGPVLEVGGVLLDTASVGGAKRYGAPASFYRCTDGLVRISAMEDHQWQGVVTAMGSPAWAKGFATVEARIADPDEVDRHVAGWAATKTKLDAETELQAHGVPATAVYSPAEILASPQLAHRQAFDRMALGDGCDATVVGLPFRTTATGGERRHRSLRGLRVLEASRVLAVPLAGAILGALGAEVIKLEDLPRLDMYRRRGPYIEAEAGMERSAYFALMNHSKGSAGFDVDADRERLSALVDASDVVLENLGPKRATALALGASSAPATHPDLLTISSSGFGQDGPHAEYRAYAYNLQASGALGYLTRNLDGESAEIDIAWADLISAYALATIVAAWAVGPNGNVGAGIDFSMTDLVVSHFNEHLAAASLDPDADDADRANELAPYVVNEVRPDGDGWQAVSVEVEGGEALIEPVLDAAALVADEQLAARGFFVAVEHPEWGTRRLVGLPWRPHGAAALPLRPPPVLA
jgi:crotonobetainyl-CoA:carnitine CoA-transferase CaiB-like acyl-CoA transferase